LFFLKSALGFVGTSYALIIRQGDQSIRGIKMKKLLLITATLGLFLTAAATEPFAGGEELGNKSKHKTFSHQVDCNKTHIRERFSTNLSGKELEQGRGVATAVDQQVTNQ
jgi:hypothetical protein